MTDALRIGARVVVQNTSTGTLLFAGTTQFAPGKWYGAELDAATGKNDGSVQGVQYFKCRVNHGVFVRASQLKVVEHTPQQSVPAQQQQATVPRTPPRQPKVLMAPSSSGVPRVLQPPSAGISQIARAGGGIPMPRVSGLHQASAGTPTRPGSSHSSGGGSRPGSAHQRQPSNTSSLASAAASSQTPPAPVRRSSIIARPKVRMAIEEPLGPLATMDIAPPLLPEEILRVSHDASAALPSELSMPLDATPSASRTPGHNEPSVPLKQFEELRIKLKILESRRAEERVQLKESERTREEAEQFLHIRTKLAAKLAELQAELRESRKQAKELQQAREEMDAKNADLADNIELAVLDKEMAEERAANMEQEVALLKEKLDEVKMDLDIYKTSPAPGAGADAAVPGVDGESLPNGATSMGLVHLERQNERLREALMRLRDVSAESEADLQRRVKTLERENFALESLRCQNDKLREQLEQYEAQVEELKQRLDDAMGAEEMAEKLSVENMELKDKLDELRDSISVLEEDKMVSEELEDSRAENEKQLQLEIDYKDSVIREKEKKIDAVEESIADYENTINRFRELVATLQTALEEAKAIPNGDEGASKDLDARARSMKDLSEQLQSGSTRAQGKQIDLELRKLDAMQSVENLELVQSYLHDSFFRNENNAIRVYLLFKRIMFKADLVRKHIDQNRSLANRVKNDDLSEDLLPAFEMCERLHLLSELAAHFVWFMSQCPAETFLKLGSLYEDINGNDKRLNAFIDMLRAENLKEIDCLIELDRAVAHLEHLSGLYVETSKTVMHQQACIAAHQLEFSNDRLHVLMSLTKECMSTSPDPASPGIKLASELVEPIDDILTLLSQSKTATRKLSRRFLDISSTSSLVKMETCGQVKTLLNVNRKMMKFCNDAYTQIKQQMVGYTEATASVVAGTLQRTIYTVTESALKQAEVTAWEGSRKTFAGYNQELARVHAAIEDDAKLERHETGLTPVSVRSAAFKTDMVTTSEMNRHIQISNEEVNAMERALQESAVKVELLESRMEAVKKQNETLGVVQKDLQKSKEQETTYARAIETYVSQIEELEQENTKLKAAVGQSEQQAASRAEVERRMSFVHQAPVLNSDESQMENLGHIQFNIQISALKSAIRFLRAENSRLRSIGSLDDIFGAPAVKTKPIAPLSTASREALKSTALEARSLIKDSIKVASSLRVVDISHQRNKKWTHSRMTPEFEFYQQQSLVNTLAEKTTEMRSKLKLLTANIHPALRVAL